MLPYHRHRVGGFTLVEVVFAVGILTIGALMLSAALSSSERMQSIARERAIANNILRAYIERMRQQYPQSSNDGDMTELVIRGIPSATNSSYGQGDWDVTDGIKRACTSSDFTASGYLPDSTPIYDLMKLYSTGLVERGVLKKATANVYWATDETGANFGPALTATVTTPWSVASISTASAMASSDKSSLGLPRDLNGSGDASQTDVVQAQYSQKKNIVLVPMKIEFTWVSGSARNVDSTTPNQKLTIYAVFSPQH